ncbi:hypothetical protein RHMOL_Rhmol11G0045100 [Rhododendron molle]|uniref:Uncharacterized protein n=1 Tax=Rhododendron molle TaxID=49168 RepID=A0ACC0LQ34_RHOML|nr:hypothetical protein RHMOL_Rhmol11G0045100 [Rhododendron molle]
MADNGNNGGGGDVVDHPADEGVPMETEIEMQQPTRAVEGVGAVVTGGSNGDQGQQQKVGDESVRRMLEDEPRASEKIGAVEPVVEALDSSTAVEGSIMIGGDSGGAGGSGASGDDVGSSGSPPRDLAKGKGVTGVEEEITEVRVEYREEDVLFWRAEGSSSHRPVTNKTSQSS